MVPANVAKVQVKPLDEVYVNKPVIGKAKLTATSSPSNFRPMSVSKVKTSTACAGTLAAKLRICNPHCPFVQMFDTEQFVESQNSSAQAESAGILNELPDSFCDFDLPLSHEGNLCQSKYVGSTRRPAHTLLCCQEPG